MDDGIHSCSDGESDDLLGAALVDVDHQLPVGRVQRENVGAVDHRLTSLNCACDRISIHHIADDEGVLIKAEVAESRIRLRRVPDHQSWLVAGFD